MRTAQEQRARAEQIMKERREAEIKQAIEEAAYEVECLQDQYPTRTTFSLKVSECNGYAKKIMEFFESYGYSVRYSNDNLYILIAC